jgi:hypothetical protein
MVETEAGDALTRKGLLKPVPTFNVIELSASLGAPRLAAQRRYFAGQPSTVDATSSIMFPSGSSK